MVDELVSLVVEHGSGKGSLHPTKLTLIYYSRPRAQAEIKVKLEQY